MMSLLSLALVQPAAAIDVEIRHRGVVVIYRLDVGETIADSWVELANGGGRKGRARMPEVRVGIDALETDKGLQVTVLIEELAEETEVIVNPTLLLLDDNPRAWYSAGNQVPLVRTRTGSQNATVYLATVPVTEILVFPEGEHGDEVIKAM